MRAYGVKQATHVKEEKRMGGTSAEGTASMERRLYP